MPPNNSISKEANTNRGRYTPPVKFKRTSGLSRAARPTPRPQETSGGTRHSSVQGEAPRPRKRGPSRLGENADRNTDHGNSAKAETLVAGGPLETGGERVVVSIVALRVVSDSTHTCAFRLDPLCGSYVELEKAINSKITF